jgi:FkbM family methyltransferase
MAFGHRVGSGGTVLAAEPDPQNLPVLRKHIALNGLQSVVRVVPAALSDSAGQASLSMDSLQSHVSDQGSVAITLSTLDAEVGEGKWDLLLIDVEGFEEKVLRGGRQLLSDPSRRPTVIMIEVHPYAWVELGISSESLLNLLRQFGYEVRHMDGTEVSIIEHYGHIVATVARS